MFLNKFLLLKILCILNISPMMSGLATHYGHGWDNRTGSSGIRVNSNDPVAAHRTLPFGTIVRVINNDPKSIRYKTSTVVVIFDRGPYGKGRVLDMMPHSLWDLSGNKCGGLKVKLKIIDSTYACNSYQCLRKNLKVNRITDKVLLHMLTNLKGE